MATTAQIQVPAVPTTEDTALTLLQYLYASSGVVTDSNIGSVVRTYSEAMGSVDEIQGISIQTEAFQALVYSAYSAFNISPLPATSAVGTLTFSTISGTPLPAGQSVGIPLSTLAQTSAGIQYATTSAAILASGQISVNIPIQAVTPGSNTNTPANTITQLLGSLTYPLSITNLLPITGGNDAESPDQTQARFTSTIQSIGLASPIAIANAMIGVSFGQESVKYCTVFEQWIQDVEEDLTPVPGFEVCCDDGSGSASAGLLSVVTTVLSSGASGYSPVGYRPAGVPFTVSSVIPVSASSNVIANVINSNNATQMATSITQAVAGYFDTLNFGDSAELTQLIASIANISFGQLSSLSVTMLDGTGTSVTEITAGPTSRIILQTNSVVVN